MAKLKVKNLTMKTVRFMLKISIDMSYWQTVGNLIIHPNNR